MSGTCRCAGPSRRLSTSADRSSRNGVTLHRGELVWRRCCESNGDMRTNRCTPRSGGKQTVREAPAQDEGGREEPSLLALGGLVHFHGGSLGARPIVGTCAASSRSSPARRSRRRRRALRRPHRARRTRRRTATASPGRPAPSRARPPSRPAPRRAGRPGSPRRPTPRSAPGAPWPPRGRLRSPSSCSRSAETRPSSLVTAPRCRRRPTGPGFGDLGLELGPSGLELVAVRDSARPRLSRSPSASSRM